MPEEHLGQIGFEYAWKELLLRSQKSGTLLLLGQRSPVDVIC
jgi:golgi-specific brefeldin A-resistance guanine nucleotide exchange factor 1